jgi:hypothetical protein
MPEMKGRSLEELDEIFEAGISARKFRGLRMPDRGRSYA